jgi:hypothetical protein
MRTIEPVGTVPLPTPGGGIAVTIHVEYDPQDFTPSALADRGDARQPAYVAFSVIGHIGGHTLDLGIRRDDIPVQGLPADLDGLVGTEPLAGLIAEYRDRLTDLTIHLARLGMATGEDVAVALSVEDLAFLRHCLMLTELRWREAIDGAQAAARQPQRADPSPPGFMNIEPTPGGYRAVAHRFSAELRRVEQFGTRLGRLLDRTRDTAGENDEDEGPQ